MQPAFLVAIFDTREDTVGQLANVGGVKQTTNEALSGLLGSETSSLVDAVLQFVERYDDVINRYFVWWSPLVSFCHLFYYYLA